LSHIPGQAAAMLESFGFTINWPKSQLRLTKKIIFLGLELDSTAMTIAIPKDKACQIKDDIRRLIDGRRNTIRSVCSVVGKLVATGPANRFARLYTNRCLTEITEALAACNDNYRSIMHLSPAAIRDLKDQSALLVGCKAPIFEPDPDLEIKTDASEDGWGVFAPFRNDTYRKFGGRWGPAQADTHINTLP